MASIDWIGRVKTEAAERWKVGRPLLVSQIPAVLRGQFDLADVLAGRRLLSALQFDGRHELEFFQDPDRAQVWAVLPKGAEVGDVREVFARPSATKYAEFLTETPPKFKPWFWAAFIKFLEDGKRRWILSTHYVDLDKADAAPLNGIEVMNGDVAFPGPGTPADNESVLRNITNWAERNSCSLEKFQVGVQTETKTLPHPKSILAFETLSQDELRRIVIPLDIVFKLLRR